MRTRITTLNWKEYIQSFACFPIEGQVIKALDDCIYTVIQVRKQSIVLQQHVM